MAYLGQTNPNDAALQSLISTLIPQRYTNANDDGLTFVKRPYNKPENPYQLRVSDAEVEKKVYQDVFTDAKNELKGFADTSDSYVQRIAAYCDAQPINAGIAALAFGLILGKLL